MAFPYRTIIEFVDNRVGPPHVAKEIRINGTPILVAEDGVTIEWGRDRATTVTIELLPDEIHFISDPSDKVSG